MLRIKQVKIYVYDADGNHTLNKQLLLIILIATSDCKIINVSPLVFQESFSCSLSLAIPLVNSYCLGEW